MIRTSEVDAVFFALRCQRCDESPDGATAPAFAELVLGPMPRELQATRASAAWWIRPIDRRGTVATWQTQAWQERLMTPEPTQRTHHDPKTLLGRDYVPLVRRRETIEFGRCRRCRKTVPRRQAGWIMDAATRALRAGSRNVYV